jgi:ABC-type tungstate transport system substrate-binding protein
VHNPAFLLLFAYGLDRTLSRIKSSWVKPIVLIGLILFMLISEIATDWPVFSNEFNWFHL